MNVYGFLHHCKLKICKSYSFKSKTRCIYPCWKCTMHFELEVTRILFYSSCYHSQSPEGNILYPISHLPFTFWILVVSLITYIPIALKLVVAVINNYLVVTCDENFFKYLSFLFLKYLRLWAMPSLMLFLPLNSKTLHTFYSFS